MLYVVETFSGIGSQAKALSRRRIDHQILATCDWDINAIIAYDIIHNGEQNLNEIDHLEDVELNDLIVPLNISNSGKVALTESAKRNLPRQVKLSLYFAINRTNNLIDIRSLRGSDLPNLANLLTYSFPCQDLSVAGSWQGNEGGIDRDANNRSSLLWEIERILYERNSEKLPLPRFLLMENVSNILSANHKDNFEEWKNQLEILGYHNFVFTLNASKFGVPQKRVRTYMISVHCNSEDEALFVERYFSNINEDNFHVLYPREEFFLQDSLRTDYTNEQYLFEARYSNPNFTTSRRSIYEENLHIDEETLILPTITTKQDRHPNSGLIDFPIHEHGKAPYRYLTPRECFILMGFDEADFQRIIDNNINSTRNNFFFVRDKLNRLAGNSICVNVLESIFECINGLNDLLELNFNNN